MITVFTPTYNRAYIIDILYRSLLAQTNTEFEWIIVDDGSTDNTEEYFQQIKQNKNPFPIIYIKQSNGGKHRAINRGVHLAHGELFFIVDSDDYLTPNAIEKLYRWRDSLDYKLPWAGISGARGYGENQYIGSVCDQKDYVDAKNTERDKYGLVGDKAEAYFTEVLKKYPFPEIEGENFITEEVVWNAIAKDGYYLRWFKDIIYICNYLEDGLTKNNTKYVRNPKGVLLWARGQLSAFPKDFTKKLYAVDGYCVAVNGTKNNKTIAKELGVNRVWVFMVKTARKIKGVLCSRKNAKKKMQ